MFCTNCGSRLERSWGHCSNCGARVQEAQTPSVTPTSNPYKSDSSKANSPKFKLGCGGIILVLIAASLISSAFRSSDSSTSDPSPSPTTDRQELTLQEAIEKTMGPGSTIQELAKANCFLFEPYTPEYFSRLAKEVPAVLPNYKKVKEPRKARAFIQDNELQQTNFLSDYQQAFNDGIKATLKVVEDRINFSTFVKGGDNWNEVMGEAILKDCESLRDYPVVLSQVTELQNELDRIRGLSQNIPWYPDGFEPLSLNADFAYQNVRGYCQLGDSCARFKIVGKVACQSLYIKVNFLNSAGEVVDWGNELLTLPANQVALIDIATFTNIDAWQLAELNCY
jgi:hypothetical protein